MISNSVYKLLAKYGQTSSWAIWSAPKNGNWKSKDSIGDLSVFSNANICAQQNDEYIFVGLNPSRKISSAPWSNFHSNDRYAQDYKLRYALKDTKYWGSFMIDLYPDIVDVNSADAMGKATSAATNISDLIQIWNILGEKATVVAMGNEAWKVLRKILPANIPLVKIKHYSARVNIDDYRNTVLQQLP